MDDGHWVPNLLCRNEKRSTSGTLAASVSRARHPEPWSLGGLRFSTFRQAAIEVFNEGAPLPGSYRPSKKVDEGALPPLTCGTGTGFSFSDGEAFMVARAAHYLSCGRGTQRPSLRACGGGKACSGRGHLGMRANNTCCGGLSPGRSHGIVQIAASRASKPESVICPVAARVQTCGLRLGCSFCCGSRTKSASWAEPQF